MNIPKLTLIWVFWIDLCPGINSDAQYREFVSWIGKPENPPPYTETPQPLQQLPSAPVIVVTSAVQITSGVNQIAVVNPPIGSKPSRITCRSCGADIVTRVEHQTATKTHLLALLLCLLGCWCCVCIPYCTDFCRNADHYCPNCNSYIVAYRV